MDRIRINGGHRLKGEVVISGAKNAVLPILAATLLCREPVHLRNIPRLRDITTIRKLLRHLGLTFSDTPDGIEIHPGELKTSEAPYELVKTMRASVLVLGPLVARFGEARVSLPGGCSIGARPIDLHLMGLEKMGAEIEILHGYVQARAKRLRGCRIYLDQPTVTGTENLMMAGTLAEGVTVIENAAREPEVENLANFLKQCGANISGAGTEVITVKGVSKLGGAEFTVMPDRIEAGTFLVAAAMTGGDIFARGCPAIYLESLLAKLREAGLTVNEDEKGVRVASTGRIGAVDLNTQPFPGFPTDMQAQMMAMTALSDGLSVITENIFENRLTHVAELQRMGADIKIHDRSVVIRGVPHLSGAPVMATDLRASACLVLGGLAAEGETEISRVYHLDRGYEKIEEKFSALGADIKRIQ